MTIKLVAFDMDGTFLNSQNTYNHDRFGLILNKLRTKDIRVVSASGSQYQRLITQFADFKDQMDFISQNGAVVHSDEQPLLVQKMSPSAAVTTLQQIKRQLPLDEIDVQVVGYKAAYVDEKTSDLAFAATSRFFTELKRVPNLYDVTPATLHDQITGIGLTIGDRLDYDQTVATIRQMLPAELNGQTTGFNTHLISERSVSKARGLRYLQEKYNVADDELMTFGDNENDLSMLTITPHGYAMANATPRVKALTKHQTDSNDDEGVLNVLARLAD